MKFHSAAITDIGKLRSENEDRFLYDERRGLFGIADGIGGMPGGGEAAECTVHAITSHLPEHAEQAEIVALVQAASARVRSLGMVMNPPHGIGSTLTFGVFKGAKLQLAHVGDSRAYVLKDGALRCLTRDHTIENEIHKLRARGESIELTAANCKALTRCMGQPGVPEVDYRELLLTPGDRFLFTTDGIPQLIDEAELAAMVAEPASPTEILKIMVQTALQRGGHDNLTAVLVFIDSF